VRADHFHDHLSAALAAVRVEVPALYRSSSAAFGAHVVAAEVDDERVALVRVGDELRVVAGAAAPTVRARASNATLCEILGGRLTILEALRGDLLELRGDLTDLLALERALHLFIQGAVRAPSLPKILASYRRPVEVS